MNGDIIVASLASKLSPHGLTLEVDGDLGRWAGHLRTAAGADGVNPCFDPARSRAAAVDGFWVRAMDAGGRAVGCCAYRILGAGTFTDLLRSGRLWGDRPAGERPAGGRAAGGRAAGGRAAGGRPIACVLPDTVPGFHGVVGHIGGLWLHPEYRGKGISDLLFQPARAVALDRFPLAWDTAIAFRRIAANRLWDTYEFERTVLCVDGFFPPTGAAERVYLGYSSRRHLVDRLREWTGQTAGAPA